MPTPKRHRVVIWGLGFGIWDFKHANKRTYLQRHRDCRSADRSSGLVPRRRLDPSCLQDRWLADDAVAGQCDRIPRGSGVSPSRSVRDVGTADGEAVNAQRRRHYRQGLRAGAEDRGRCVVAALRRLARGDAEQVRAERRSALMVAASGSAPASPERADASRRVLFVTGKLAEPALRRVLSEADLPFSADVAVMRITVAALMTTEWIARFLEVPSGTDLVMIPGLCEGDAAAVAASTGVRVEKGPKDLREIPQYFGRAEAARDYGAWDIEILAEINNAPRLTPAAIHAAAEYFRTTGADVIDIGCTPGLQFPNLGAIVR